MVTIKLTEENINMAIDAAHEILLKGGIVAYPTETFYALGVKFDICDSLKRLYELKKRPGDKAMPVIIGDKMQLRQLVPEAWLNKMPLPAKSLIDRFWPGPLTLILPANETLSEYLTAKSGKAAVRIPGESFALQLAKKAGFPITATSANISGMAPSCNAESIIKYYGGGIDLIIDGGTTAGGLPSTIVDVSECGIKLIRKGVISCGQIIRVCGVEIHEQR